MATPVHATSSHLLVVDDDHRIRNLLKEYLGRAGFRVTGAADAATAKRLFAALEFDLAVIDVMMPGENGLALTRWVRGRPGAGATTPVLILTARDFPADRIEGLGAGADDYLAKPFEPQELVLRIAAILRRTAAAPKSLRPLGLGLCTFDPARGELMRGDAAIRLTEAEVRLLRQLALAAHSPVDRLHLASNDAAASCRAVDIHVTRLRRKIETDPGNPRYLQTVRGVGYLLAPD